MPRESVRQTRTGTARTSNNSDDPPCIFVDKYDPKWTDLYGTLVKESVGKGGVLQKCLQSKDQPNKGQGPSNAADVARPTMRAGQESTGLDFNPRAKATRDWCKTVGEVAMPTTSDGDQAEKNPGPDYQESILKNIKQRN
jgi:hypothetical protein